MGVSTARLCTATFFFLCSVTAIAEAYDRITFRSQYGPFDESYSDKFEIKKPATINNDALQVTPDSAAKNFNLLNNSGRILLKQPFRLWEGDDTKSNETDRVVASFNSSFLVNVYHLSNDSVGEGLAFLIAPDLELPSNSYGEYLGLTNYTTDGNSTNKVVAIELDTFKQSFDPDDNHLGLNINSVRSKAAVSLTPLGIQISPKGAKFYNIWVQYDGNNRVIEIYIAEQGEKNGSTPERPRSPVLRSDLDLSYVVDQNSYFGFSASTGNATQLNCVLRWNLTVEHFTEKTPPWLSIGLGVGVPIFVLLLIGVLGLAYYLYKNRMNRSNSTILGAIKTMQGMPREFEFRELKKATNNFDEKNKLGQGGYGMVYRGMLLSENLEIAVKWFSRDNIKGEGDFLAELTIINRLRHKHLVRLLGWCHKNGKLLLVYDYMPKCSLDKHLFIEPDKEPLNWNLRYKIVSEVASALHYLHNEFDQRVVHRDLKASNIMLDANFNARLGDFGLARALDNEKTSYAEAEGVLGTIGYIAPECFHTGKATQQSDVYAFGVVLMEVVCGQRPGTKNAGFQLLVDWVWFLHPVGRVLEAVDQRLGTDYVVEEAERLLLLALACCHAIASERPKTQAIVQILSGSLPVPHVPPFKPPFVWPAAVPLDVEVSITDTTSLTTSMISQFSQQFLSRESEGCTEHYMV